MTSEEADAANGKVSTTSPIGRALLNKEVGDEVKVVSRAAPRSWRSVSSPPSTKSF